MIKSDSGYPQSSRGVTCEKKTCRSWPLKCFCVWKKVGKQSFPKLHSDFKQSSSASDFTQHPLLSDQQFTPWLGWVTCAEIIIILSNCSRVDASHVVHYLKWEGDSVSLRPRWQLLPVHLPLCSSQGAAPGEWRPSCLCVGRVCVCVRTSVCTHVLPLVCVFVICETERERALDISHCWQVADGVLTAHDSDVFISAGVKHIWTRCYNWLLTG